MIIAKDLSKIYAGVTVLEIPILEIKAGQTLGLVGNNGAGKTTFFNLLLDLIAPTTGFISSKDIKVKESEAWKEYTSAYIDESFLIGYLTPEEYFYFIGELRGMNRTDIDLFVDKFNDFFNGELLGKNKYLRDLSKGNQKKAGIVGALIGNPEVVILDEPFSNLDPSTQIRLKSILYSITKETNNTVFISSHDLGHVTEVSDRIIVLEKGIIVKDIQTSEKTLKELQSYFSVE